MWGGVDSHFNVLNRPNPQTKNKVVSLAISTTLTTELNNPVIIQCHPLFLHNFIHLLLNGITYSLA